MAGDNNVDAFTTFNLGDSFMAHSPLQLIVKFSDCDNDQLLVTLQKVWSPHSPPLSFSMNGAITVLLAGKSQKLLYFHDVGGPVKKGCISFIQKWGQKLW